MRKYFLTFIILSFSGICFCEVKVPLDSPHLQNTSYSFYAKYINGEEIISINPRLRLTPASTIKLFTTATAVAALDADKTFETKIYYDGVINFWDTLNGNIYIQGGGDPALGSDRIKDNADMRTVLDRWTAEIKALGVKKINGNIYADTSLFGGLSLPPKTPWEDMGNYYGATADALSINDNSFTIYLKPQPIEGAIVEIDTITPAVDGLQVSSMITASAPSEPASVYAFGAPNQFNVMLYGTIPAGKADYLAASLPNPPLFAAQELKKALKAAGVKVTGNTKLITLPVSYEGKNLLLTQTSPTVGQIINIINKKSFNLYSEVMLKQLGAILGKEGSTKEGIEVIKVFLEANQISAEDFLIYDGSGLARDNFTNTYTVVSLLEAMHSHEDFEVFYNSLIIPGLDEDEKRFTRVFAGTAADKNLHLKTGYMSSVRAYSGYINDKNGRMIAFSFIVNNYTSKTAEINNIFNKLIIALANLQETKTTKPAIKNAAKN
ncbi:D-alanyl-D-alanine carboxypeptidase/D-alanyl-D-alanine-endopeptidase (penicillin-binding protein 4) [Elusimicrobium simillimum]|uniref:D-alanyl-D-alanine carboxypeptidase/D-alanyl-D-alanine endopeptidase n=1 Tax=Elusimicrobium simillimum TaxID=3143438 RepID=UPI003C6F7347